MELESNYESEASVASIEVFTLRDRIASLESTIREMEESKANFIATYKMAVEWDRESALEIIVERGKRIEELQATLRQRDTRISELEQREIQALRTIREQAE